MKKAPEAFRTISEVADLLDTPAHVLRFWESKFYQIRPVKRAGGRRYYRPDDVALINGIRVLLQDRGMTIRGVQRILQEQGVKAVAALGLPLPEVAGAEGQVLEMITLDDEASIPPEAEETEGAATAQDEPAEAEETAADPAADLAPMPAFDEVGAVPTVFLDASEWRESPAPARDAPVLREVEALSHAMPPIPEAGDVAPMDAADEVADPGLAAPPPAPPTAPPPVPPPVPDADPPSADAAAMTDDDLLTPLAAAPVVAPATAALVPPGATLAPPPPLAEPPERPVAGPAPERPRLARALRAVPRPLPAPQRDRLALAARRIDALLERMSEASGAGRW